MPSLEEVASDPSAFCLILSGHNDHPDCNGKYEYDGKENGKVKYAKVPGSSPKLFWTGHSWDCAWGGYSPESAANTPVPPLDGYDRDKGGTEIRVSYEHVEGNDVSVLASEEPSHCLPVPPPTAHHSPLCARMLMLAVC